MLIDRKSSKIKYANNNVKNDIVKKYIGYIKNTAPNVHCLTNVVTMQDVANMLLAAGGSAIMAQDIKEVDEITQITSATLLNMGVPSDEKIAAYIAAGKTANRLGHPVVFDPVGVGASKYRKNCANEILTNVTPDIVLLDVIMPHLDGIGVLEKMNMIKCDKKPICVMLSAVGQDKITQKAISLGAEYYIVKPFDIELLMKRIRELKNFKPNQNQNIFAGREIKSQYVEIPLNGEKNESTLKQKIILKLLLLILFME